MGVKDFAYRSMSQGLVLIGFVTGAVKSISHCVGTQLTKRLRFLRPFEIKKEREGILDLTALRREYADFLGSEREFKSDE